MGLSSQYIVGFVDFTREGAAEGVISDIPPPHEQHASLATLLKLDV